MKKMKLLLYMMCMLFVTFTYTDVVKAEEILPTDVTEPAENNAFVGVQGSFEMDADAILTKINELRLQLGCVPLKWSYDLEYIARIRAVENAIRRTEIRSTELKSPNGISGEVEMIGRTDEPDIISAISQWIENNKMGFGVLLDPDLRSIGCALFSSDKTEFSKLMCVELSGEVSLNETRLPRIKDCIQTVEVPKERLIYRITPSRKVEEVKIKETITFSTELQYCDEYDVSVVDFYGVNWNAQEKVSQEEIPIGKDGQLKVNTYNNIEVSAVSKKWTEIKGQFEFEIPFTKIKIDKKNFPGLYKILKEKDYDRNKDGYLSRNECYRIYEITSNKAISSMQGVENFPNLRWAYISNYTGTTFKVPKDIDFVRMWIMPKKSKLVIDAPNLKSLTMHSFSIKRRKDGTYQVGGWSTSFNTKLKTLDLSKCKSLNNFHISNKKMTTLKLPKKKDNKIRYIRIDEAAMTSLNLKNCSKLGYLCVWGMRKIKALDLRKNTNLEAVDLIYDRSLTKVDVSTCKKLKGMYLYCNKDGLKNRIKLPKGKKVKFPKNGKYTNKYENKYLNMK